MSSWVQPERNGLEIAIIGMACRFPGARNVDAFWRNLRNGVESIYFFTDQELEAAGVAPEILKNPNYVKARPVLQDVECFDAALFSFNPREAELMDPQHRFFLECAWEALEDAGYTSERYAGSIGVYAGAGMSTYLINNILSELDPARVEDATPLFIGNDKDYLPTRVSYKLNLRGPSLNVQTACSTGLVALHLACRGLLGGECDLALAGAVNVDADQSTGYFYQAGGILSPDGHCRAFDARAQGTLGGSGVGLVVLKRLDDALNDSDHTCAVVKGSAINNDGALKVGYTAPSVEGQSQVITLALALSEIAADTIGYVETHGTGTVLGDPIEIEALTQAFRAHTQKRGFCAIGSVKTNIGHLGPAAGMAGLIKTILVLQHKEIPPSLHFERPNPQIDFAGSPFHVNATLAAWPATSTPRRAGVSSFGFGGTNAHVILEEAPATEPLGTSPPWHLMLISAKSSTALENATTQLAEHLQQHPDLDLADVAYTLAVGRTALQHRRIAICQDRSDAAQALETRDPKRVLSALAGARGQGRPVAFLFTGQGAQYVDMAAEWYRHEPRFRDIIDQCSAILQPPLGLDLRRVLYAGSDASEANPEQLNETWLTQPALFVIEYALASLLGTWGVHPQAIIGHSIGEYVAACLAGVFSLEQALGLVAARGRLMQSLPRGAMLSVPLAEQQVERLLGGSLCLAAVNGPALCVVSGPVEAIDGLEQQLAAQGLPCRRLHTSHAFHSSMMEPALESFARQFQGLKLRAPRIPYVSNVTGTWITVDQATDPDYWTQQLRQPVRFAQGVGELLKDPHQVLLEIGPGHALSTFARQHLATTPERVILTTLPHPHDRLSDRAFLLQTLGRLWLCGVEIDWLAFYAGQQRRRVSLPTYPFDRGRYWIQGRRSTSLPLLAPVKTPDAQGPDAAPQAVEQAPTARAGYPRPDVGTAYVAPGNDIEERLASICAQLMGIERIGIYDNFFELGGHSLLAIQLMSRVQEAFALTIPIQAFFEAPTISDLAKALVDRQLENIADAQALDAVIAEVEGLSAEELQRLLKEEPEGDGRL